MNRISSPATAVALLAALAAPLLAAPAAGQACEVDRLVHPNPQIDDGQAGFRSLALDVDRILVGAPGRDELGTDSGAAYVYERNGSVWGAGIKLLPSIGAAGDLFGLEVALSGDIAAVAVGPKVSPLPQDGRVHVFERVSGVWSETLVLTRGNGFASSLALEGTRLVVGATGEAFVYEKISGLWALSQQLTPSDPELGSRFGWDVAIDSPYLVVTDPAHTHGGATSGCGYVYFESGGTWTEIWETRALVTGGFQGDSVSLQQGTIVLGAPISDEPGGVPSGTAYVYERSGSTFPLSATLVPSNPTPFGRFGWSVDVREDGKGLAVGALSSEAWLFEDSGGGWSETTRLQSIYTTSFDYFGSAVGLEGDDLVVGAPQADDGAQDAGVVSVWSTSGTAFPSLGGSPTQLSLSAGGTQSLAVNHCVEFGGDLYFVVGNIGFTTPGIPFGGFVIPLNPGPYLVYTINNPNSPILSGSFGNLDQLGDALATFNLPAGTDPVLVGSKVNHAYGVLDPVSITLKAVSNPVTCTLLP
jgi:hypothetical protein